jgi:hypothetical protein
MKAITLSTQTTELPEGYECFLVLDDDYNPDSTTWDNPWYLTITDKFGKAIEQGVNGHPAKNAFVFGKSHDSHNLFGVLGSCNDVKRWKDDSLSSATSQDCDKTIVTQLKAEGKPNTITTDIPKMVTGPIDDFVKAYSNSEEVFVKQADRKVAQSQVAINSKRIYKLEQAVAERKGLAKQITKMQKMLDEFDKIKKELDQARELQKLLKKLR